MSRYIFIASLLVVALGACRGRPPYASGYLGDYSELEKSDRYEDSWSWRRPGTDFTEYDRFVIEPVLVNLIPDSPARDFDPAEIRRITEDLRAGLVAAIEPYYAVVRRGGAHTLRVQVILTHVKMATATENGEIAVEAEVFDSVTGTRLGMTVTYLEWTEADGLAAAYAEWGQRLVSLVE